MYTPSNRCAPGCSQARTKAKLARLGSETEVYSMHSSAQPSRRTLKPSQAVFHRDQTQATDDIVERGVYLEQVQLPECPFWLPVSDHGMSRPDPECMAYTCVDWLSFNSPQGTVLGACGSPELCSIVQDLWWLIAVSLAVSR